MHRLSLPRQFGLVVEKFKLPRPTSLPATTASRNWLASIALVAMSTDGSTDRGQRCYRSVHRQAGSRHRRDAIAHIGENMNSAFAAKLSVD